MAADLAAVAVLLEVAAHPAAGNSTIKNASPEAGIFNQIKSVLCLAFDLFTTVVRCFFAQSFFDTNQLVVFSNTVRTAHRTSSDLACSSTNSQVSDGSVFSFARTVRDNCNGRAPFFAILIAASLGARTDLVEFKSGWS